MVNPSPAQQQRTSYGSAKRLRQSVESVINTITIFPNTVVMMTVGCDDCGERFAVGHPKAFQDPGLAEMQAIWLKDQFIWDHIQEKRHASSIPLPGAHAMKATAPVL